MRQLKLSDLVREKAEDMDICVIPARGGSKRIPRKNIRTFVGKPMIVHSIDIALKSGLFDIVVVSTDDEEIKQVSIESGAQVPFLRNQELADDYTPTVPVVQNAINQLFALNVSISSVCCLYPCAPFVSFEDLSEAKRISQSSSRFVYPVCEFPSSIYRSMECNQQGILSPVFVEHEWTRSQDLPCRYYDAGQFYWAKVNTWLEGNGLQSNGHGIVVPSWRVVDIDTLDDWKRAERLWKLNSE